MLREEETGFNTKGNWNYQRALNTCSFILRDFPIAQIKNLLATQKTRVWSLGWEDPLEKEKATHSSILAWRIPWTGEPGRLQSIGSQRVGHDWETGTGIHSRGLTDKQNSECDEHYQESNTKKESNTENQEMGAWGKQLLQAEVVHGTATWEIQLLQKTYWRETNQDSTG